MINKKIKTLFFWLFLILLSIGGNSQNLYDHYQSVKTTKPHSALEVFVDSLINLANQQKDFRSPIKIAHNFYIELYKKRDYVRALKYALIEIKYLKSIGDYGKSYSNALYNSGRFYFNNHEFDNAIKQYEKVIELGNDKKKIGQSYGEIGRCYSSKGFFYKSINYFKKGIGLLEERNEFRSLFSHYISLAYTYRCIGDQKSFIEGIAILNKAKKLNTHLNFSKKVNLLLDLNNAYANCYNEGVGFAFNKARFYYLKNEQIGLNVQDSVNVSLTYNNLAHLYNIEKKDSAKYYIEKGLEYVLEKETKARLYDNASQYFIIKNKLQQALSSIHKSLEINLGIPLAIEKVPSKFDLNASTLKEYTLFCLKKKTEVLLKLYEQEKDSKYLKNAIEYTKAADQLVSIINESSTEGQTKLFWRKEASQAYLYGAYAAHLLGDSKTAFSFMEKNKALLLSESILKNTEFQNLPKHISDEETKLKKTIYELENRLSKNENAVLQDSLFNIKRVHENYIDSLKTIFPKYFNRRIDIAQIPLSEVQQELKKD